MTRFSRLFLVAAVVAVSFLSPLVAFAQEAASSTTVSAKPWADLVTPYVIEILSTVITVAIAWVAAQFTRLTGINVAAKYRESLHSAAMTGVALALQRLNLAAADFKIDVHSKVLVDAERWVYDSVPDALKYLGVDAESVRKLVESKVKIMAETGVTPVPTDAFALAPFSGDKDIASGSISASSLRTG